MAAHLPPAQSDYDPKPRSEQARSERRKGAGSISREARESDGRFQVSVVRADGKGRRYGWARSEAEAELKLAQLRKVESGLKLYKWADEFVALWVAAGTDAEKRQSALEEFLKKWAGATP